MSLLHILWTGLTDHLGGEMALVGLGILLVYGSRQTHTVPKFRKLPSAYAGVQHTAQADLFIQSLCHLGFKPIGTFDVSMSSAVQMFIELYHSANQLYVATIVSVRSETGNFSFIEFHTDLAPHGNITTNNSKHAGIFYYPPDKMVAKVPWRKTVEEILGLHVELCEAAREHGFTPVPLKPGELESCFIRNIRESFEDQVKCGRNLKVAEDVYKQTFKGVLISVPLVWHKMVYGFLYELHRPTNRAFCAILGRRLQKARLMTEPYRTA